MSFSIAEAFVDISPKVDQGKFGAEAEKVGGSFGKSVAKFAAIGTAAVAAFGAAAIKGSFNLASTGDELDKTSQKLGVTTDFLQDLNHWANQNGVSQGNMERAMGRLNQRLGDGSAEGNKYVQAMHKLGVETQDASGNVRAAEDVFRDNVDALMGIEDASARAAMASEIFGTKTARELMPAISDGSLTLEEATAAMDGYGRLTEEQIAKSVEFTDTWDRIKTAGTAMLQQFWYPFMAFINDTVFPVIENHLLPAIRAIFEAFRSGDGALENLRNGFSAIGDVGVGLFERILEGAQNLFDKLVEWLTGGGVEQIVNGLMEGRERLFNAALVLFPVILNALIQIIPQVISFITNTLIPGIIGAILEAVPILLDSALTLFTELVNALIEVLPVVIDGIIELVSSVAEMLITLVPELLAAAIELFTSLLDAVIEILPELIDLLLGTLLPDVLETILSMIPELLSTALELFMMLVDAVIDVLPTLLTTLLTVVLPKVLSTLLSMIPQLITTAIEVFFALILGLLDVLPDLLRTLLVDVLPQVISTLIGMIPELIVTAIEVFLALIDGLLEVLPQLIATIATDVIPGIITAIIEAVPQLVQAGVDLISGFIRGIVQKARDIRSAVTSAITDKLPGFVKSALGIRSPSRVFMEIGDQTAEGMEVGIKDRADKVHEAAEELVHVPNTQKIGAYNPLGRFDGSQAGFASSKTFGDINIHIKSNTDLSDPIERRKIATALKGEIMRMEREIA